MSRARVFVYSVFLLWNQQSWAASADIPIELSDIPNLTISYYDIHGSTVRELRAQMNALGPENPNDHSRGHGYTRWHVDGHWSTNTIGKKCWVTSVDLKFSAEMILPRVDDLGALSSDTLTKWDTFLHNLIIHERGHAEFPLQHFPDVIAAVKAASCEGADAAFLQAVNALKAHDVEYDAETKHGKTQGVIF